MDTIDEISNVVLEDFARLYKRNLDSVQFSGALSGDELPGIVAKVVLYLTAQGYKPLSKEGKELLSNLQYFV